MKKIKSRTLLSIVVSVIITIVLNKYWLIFKPMLVSLDIEGQGKCSIEVYLNKKNDDKFIKAKQESVDVDLDKIHHAELFVKRSRFPKRVKFVISDVKPNEQIILNNIQIGNFNISDLSKFNIIGANFVIQNNKLLLNSDSSAISLIYQDTLKARTSIKFDFKIFVIILILSYLLAYKLTNYIADFKTVQGKSRIDIIFLTIFFCFLFIPMSHINHDEISTQENRPLAKWQHLIKENNEINFEFGKNFNEWFNDRFALRQKFVIFRNTITMFVENKCEKGFFDNDNKTIYPNWSFGHIDIKTIKYNFKALYELNNFFEENNIKLYTLIVPTKADIHTTRYNYINDKYVHDDFLNYVNYLQKENKIKVIYPYSEMLKAVENGKQLYFKTEHHWTDDGAFIGYQELMKIIINDYPNVTVLANDDFEYFYSTKVRGDFLRDLNFGQDCSRIGISDSLCKKYHKYNYTYYKHKDFDKLKVSVINKPKHRYKLYKYDKGANLRVLLLGTSQNENLTEFIPFTFKNVKRLRNNNVKDISTNEEFKIIKHYEQEILDYQPDIVIFCITYNNIKELHDLFNME